MRNAAPSLFSVILLAALGGCTSISFKQGAGGDEFRRAEASCLSTTSERNAFAQCMEAKGWWTRSMEELSGLGFVPAGEDGAATTAADAPADTPLPGSATPAPKPAGKAASPAMAAPAPRDPLARIRIAMWSKAGAGGSELMASQSQCLSGLGELHQPDPVAGTVTRGMYECLRKQGWTGMTLR